MMIFERWGKGSAAFFAGFAIAAVLGITLLVVVIALILPGLMNKASLLINQKPLLSLGVGFLAIFVLPFALLMLFATIVLILLLGIIPIVGGLIWLLILMFGMGAILVQGGLALARDSQ